jgi:hypothetical protein
MFDVHKIRSRQPIKPNLELSTPNFELPTPNSNVAFAGAIFLSLSSVYSK